MIHQGYKTSAYTITLDDDPIVHQIIEKSTGLASKHYTDPFSLAKDAENLTPKAVFIDIKLGHLRTTGLDILPLLRKAWPYCPILVVTSSPCEESIHRALTTGADDFLRKPLIPEEIVARFQLRLEDAKKKNAKDIIQFGDIVIDSLHRKVTGPKGNKIASPIEISLLVCLAHSEGELVEKETLKLKCWGGLKVTDNALHRKLHALRSLLKDVSDLVNIQTKYGGGFALQELEQEILIAG